MNRIWLWGLLRRRGGRFVAAAGGVAVAVALLASLGAFLASAKAAMTEQAVRGVAVDWQVQVQPGADLAVVLDMTRSAPGVRAALPVGYATTTGLSASTPTSTQTTGAGVVLGLPPGYQQTFPDSVRSLAGAPSGVLVAQQTAANLHAQPGEIVQIGRPGLAPVPVRVDGIVALPQADALFQHVGAPAGAQPPAPPDNVVLLPAALWHTVFDPLVTSSAPPGPPSAPGAVSTQLHVARAEALPSNPAAAYTVVTAAAHNLEARTAGAGVVGDNLATTLDKARQDAAYAQILFLFLGAPGAVLAGLLTAAVVATGADRRRRDQALLRARGASPRQLLGLAAAEAAAVGVLGAAVGLGVGFLVGQVAFGSTRFGTSTANAVSWVVAAALVGLALAAVTVLAPAWRDLRASTVVAGRAEVGRVRAPWWARYGLDVALLVAAGLVFWATAGSGYQLVVAPEGTPTISVSYWAFAGPALAWAGTGLLAWRLSDLLLGRGRRLVARGLRPVAGNLAPTVAATLARRRRVLGRSIVLLGLAVAFAVSTAVFNSTYQAQAEVDAQLTNGADVTVHPSPGAPVGPDAAANLAGVPGVRAVEPIQHRFAYVGADLQDLYGVDPATITRATTVQDSYFKGGSARALLDKLAAAPDSILVSAETVKDFQLHPGDLLNLRLTDRTGQLVTVPFHYVGIVTEFPTAPKDSFLVANAGYVAAATGSNAVGAFLVDTGGHDTAAVAARVQTLLGPSATVTDLAATRGTVGSSLTAVDLAGLTRVELAFALVLAAAAGGLVLALGLTERRRSFAITAALGATRRQLRGWLTGETTVLTAGGLLTGAVIGWALSEMLVVVLTGVFDPPPDRLAVPGPYLGAAAAITLAALTAATALTLRRTRRPSTSTLREL